ncbi:MAG: hypothetical protein D6685_07300 [Bacteroidetes bacterium]|nr:MAG: hypothetical protein D6685_07300 [Bacteroidota bacterium]
MAEPHASRREHVNRVREAFEHLGVEDRVLFLVEATASTLARGVEQAGRALAEELDRCFGGADEDDPPAEAAPEAASEAADAATDAATDAPAKQRGKSSGTAKKRGGTASRKPSTGASSTGAGSSGTPSEPDDEAA